MKDNKTREQLVHELTELHSQNAALKKAITGNISAELAAEEARRYAESIVGTVREPLLVLDADLKIISANRNFYRIFKVTPGETIGSFIYDLGNKQWDIPKLRELLEEVLPKKEAFDDFEVDHNFQDIGHKIMLLNACRIYRKDIGAKMILLAIEDITERKRLESLLIDSEEQYRRLFETASDGIVLLEKREGKITHANQATEKLLGYTEKESIGNKLQDIGVLLDMGDFQTLMQNLNKSGIINYNDVPIKTKSGHHIDTEIYLVDRAKLVQCNIRDITERKRATKELRESEDRCHALFGSSIDAVLLTAPDGRILMANPEACRIFARTEEEICRIGRNGLLDLKDPRLAAALEERKRTGQFRGELRFVRKNGTSFPGEISSVIFSDRDGNLMTSMIIRDITERKQAEEERNLSEARLTEAQAVAKIGSWETDLSTLKTKWSEETYRIFEIDPNSFQASHTGFLAFVHPEDRAKVDAAFVGSTDKHSLNSVEHRIVTPGGLVKFIEERWRIFHDDQGLPVRAAGTCQDITDRKQAEKQLQDTLESLRRALSTTIQVMVSAIEVRDPYTSGHQIRSADLARAIATEMGLSEEKIEGIRMAGSIHDIGKLSIPAEILSKPTKLSAIEFSLIKEHAKQGYEILKDVESSWPLAEIVYQHHERMDGSGYPRNLKGEEICMEARILAVADVVEAMASHRPYRPALGLDAALEEIEKNSGLLYDSPAVDICLRLFKEKGYRLE